MTADMAQQKCSNIKFYTLTFSNIQIMYLGYFVQVADFGLARFLPDDAYYTRVMGTLG